MRRKGKLRNEEKNNYMIGTEVKRRKGGRGSLEDAKKEEKKSEDYASHLRDERTWRGAVQMSVQHGQFLESLSSDQSVPFI